MENPRPTIALRVVSILFIAGLLAFLALSGIVTVLRRPETSSYFENRSLAALPQASKAGVLDGSYFSALNTYLQEQSAGRNTLLRMETILDKDLLRRPVVNEVVVREDVLLAWPDFWTYDLEWLATRVDAAADRIAAHARTAEEYGGHFYYVAVPHQGLAFPEEYPAYLQSHEDYYRDIASLFFPALEERGVTWLDMWSEFRAMGILREVSSRIDNHYHMSGALAAYRLLMERIMAETGLPLDMLSPEDYTLEQLPNHYIGSRTRKLFDLWPNGEKLSVVIPKDGLSFEREDRASWLSGPRLSRELYELPESADEPVSYSVYMGGDWPYTEIRTSRPDKPCILIYGDSFTNPVECLIWHDFDTMYSIDFRYYTEQSIDEAIASLQPEIVVCIRDYEALLKTEGNGG